MNLASGSRYTPRGLGGAQTSDFTIEQERKGKTQHRTHTGKISKRKTQHAQHTAIHEKPVVET